MLLLSLFRVTFITIDFYSYIYSGLATYTLANSQMHSGLRADVASEWDGTKQHDVLFLLSIDPPDAHQMLQIQKEAEAIGGKGAQPSPDKLYGLVRARGCEVVEVCISQ